MVFVILHISASEPKSSLKVVEPQTLELLMYVTEELAGDSMLTEPSKIIHFALVWVDSLDRIDGLFAWRVQFIQIDPILVFSKMILSLYVCVFLCIRAIFFKCFGKLATKTSKSYIHCDRFLWPLYSHFIDWNRKDTAMGWVSVYMRKFCQCRVMSWSSPRRESNGSNMGLIGRFGCLSKWTPSVSMRLFIFIACREKKTSALAQTISINKCVRTWGRKRATCPRADRSCVLWYLCEWVYVYVFGHMQVPLIKFRAPFFHIHFDQTENNTYIFYMLYFYYCD